MIKPHVILFYKLALVVWTSFTFALLEEPDILTHKIDWNSVNYREFLEESEASYDIQWVDPKVVTSFYAPDGSLNFLEDLTLHNETSGKDKEIVTFTQMCVGPENEPQWIFRFTLTCGRLGKRLLAARTVTRGGKNPGYALYLWFLDPQASETYGYKLCRISEADVKSTLANIVNEFVDRMKLHGPSKNVIPRYTNMLKAQGCAHLSEMVRTKMAERSLVNVYPSLDATVLTSLPFSCESDTCRDLTFATHRLGYREDIAYKPIDTRGASLDTVAVTRRNRMTNAYFLTPNAPPRRVMESSVSGGIISVGKSEDGHFIELKNDTHQLTYALHCSTQPTCTSCLGTLSLRPCLWCYAPHNNTGSCRPPDQCPSRLLPWLRMTDACPPVVDKAKIADGRKAVEFQGKHLNTPKYEIEDGSVCKQKCKFEELADLSSTCAVESPLPLNMIECELYLNWRYAVNETASLTVPIYLEGIVEHPANLPDTATGGRLVVLQNGDGTTPGEASKILTLAVAVPLSLIIIVVLGLTTFYCLGKYRARAAERRTSRGRYELVAPPLTAHLARNPAYLRPPLSSRSNTTQPSSSSPSGGNETSQPPSSTQSFAPLAQWMGWVPPNLLIDRKKLQLEETPIGAGNFGTVYKGTYDLGEGRIKNVAVKVLKKATPDHLRDFFREGHVMGEFRLSLRHENILPMLGYCFDEMTNGHPWLITPFMVNGDLRGYLRREGESLPLRQLLSFSHQIALGMAFLHRHKFLHRDLAARNCMLDSRLNVLIGDFGLARDVYVCDVYVSEGQMRGSYLPMKWTAIESIVEARYDYCSDVWSFGVTFWEVLSKGVEPYQGMGLEILVPFLKAGRRLPPPPGLDGDLKDDIYTLMLSTWHMIPRERPPFSILCQRLKRLLSLVDMPHKTVAIVQGTESSSSDAGTPSTENPPSKFQNSSPSETATNSRNSNELSNGQARPVGGQKIDKDDVVHVANKLANTKSLANPVPANTSASRDSPRASDCEMTDTDHNDVIPADPVTGQLRNNVGRSFDNNGYLAPKGILSSFAKDGGGVVNLKNSKRRNADPRETPVFGSSPDTEKNLSVGESNEKPPIPNYAKLQIPENGGTEDFENLDFSRNELPRTANGATIMACSSVPPILTSFEPNSRGQIYGHDLLTYQHPKPGSEPTLPKPGPQPDPHQSRNPTYHNGSLQTTPILSRYARGTTPSPRSARRPYFPVTSSMLASHPVPTLLEKQTL